MELQPGIVVADRFRLERELGKGGMGAVWLAHHLGLDLPCAIKFILAEASMSPDARARFEREAKAAAHIRSPHVVQILDYGIWQGAPYIAMEYLEGEDLGERLGRRGKLDPRETATIIGQVARALGKAHAQDIVHRDIKPSNIFILRDDDRLVAKVVDFGIAKSHTLSKGSGQTRAGALLGTPFYMSPEQVQGDRAVDHRADLWALAVVTYQCLTGRLPFESAGFIDLLVMITSAPPPVPSTVAKVPPGFDAWWAKAVAHDPAQRFQSAKELAEALYLALGISAPTPEELPLPPITTTASLAPIAAAGSTPASPPTPFGAVLPTPSTQRRRARLGVAITAIATTVTIALVVALVLALRAGPREAGSSRTERDETADSSAQPAPSALQAEAATTPSATSAGLVEPSAAPASSPALSAPPSALTPAPRPPVTAKPPQAKPSATPTKRPPPVDNRDFGI